MSDLKRLPNRLTLILLLAFQVGCSSSVKFATAGSETPPGATVTGMASYYGPKFNGRKTANGEVFDMYGLTAAHRTLPFDTKVRVTNLSNNRSVTVRINDRGPFRANRIIDLSLGAAREIGMVEDGVTKVKLEIISTQ
jgi:rare lipoprotein A